MLHGGLRMTTGISLQSQDSGFDADGHEAVKADLVALANQANTAAKVMQFSGADRLLIPVSGRARVFACSNTATVSTGIAYHTIKILRSGVSDGTLAAGLVTSNAELAAYQQVCLGEVNVSNGTMLELSVVATGGPAPTLTTANFTIRVDVSPRS